MKKVKKMKVLVIGSGGREHAIAKKLLEDSKVTDVYCAPGNPGMRKDGITILSILEEEFDALINFSKQHQIEWTFAEPEVPLVKGIVNHFQKAGLKIFGPTKEAAQIEGSKQFAKNLMLKNKVPTANFKSFDHFQEAKEFVLTHDLPLVIKADGLAAGKGVVIAETKEIAIQTLHAFMEEKSLGQSGNQIIIEEFLEGQEFSLMAFVNHDKVYPMVIAQDHKRAFDGDRGPNTGGMGAYSPVPQIDECMVEEAKETILLPIVHGMINEGIPFVGILYAGLIATPDGPKVIEFNARFGDPETQVVLPRLKSSLAQIITDLLENQIPTIQWSNQATVGVVVAAQGYPKDYQKGMILPERFTPKTNSYYAGVKEKNEKIVANGGRIFVLQSSGKTIEEAQKKVYDALERVDLPQMFYRKDIANKAFIDNQR